MSTHRARWICVSQATIGTLITLGGLLEALNLTRAAHLELEVASSGLDAAFVEMEQAYVESVLHQWSRSCAPRYQRFIGELDSLLRVVTTGLVPLTGSANIRRYARVLRAVAMVSGRCPSFSSCDDRMQIGVALIHEARQLAP